MRSFLGILLFSIGMMLFTGFSSTTDPTEDSSIVYTHDVDVGVDAIVENQTVLISTISSEVTTMATIKEFSKQSKGEINTNYLAFINLDNDIYNYRDHRIRNLTTYITLRESNQTNLHKRARDGLTSTKML